MTKEEMYMDGDTENATKEELFGEPENTVDAEELKKKIFTEIYGEPLGYNPVKELDNLFGEVLGT